ncbi:histidinol-phosphatase [Candidatus Albibeggiatoa sp. nov. NOAA]|uniref:histidinol-phosphatase n=1 Tax=Candidatus Albibeggiatoa sp. nov. NOAA TaxID=3162724 RepID=UPI0032F8223A|nr:histidinol-phosphatase [Thiotrichaceae bacterium]
MLSTLPLEFIGLAHRLADASGTVIRQYFRTPVAVDDKPDSSPVTIADREAERVMRELIQQAYPEHGIYGEEMGVENQDAEFVWVLDPIDGTKSFITGKPLFGTLISLLHHGQPILGMIDQPITRERWIGGIDLPTTLNGQAVKVRNCANLSQAILYATTPLMFEGQDKVAFERLCQQIKLPLYGADCYAYALLAMGFVDLVVEADLSPYDYCSHVPIIEQAGGVITDWQGQALGLDSDGRVVAAGDKALHQQVLNVLSG